MNKDNIAYGVAGLVLGGILTAFVVGDMRGNNWGMMNNQQAGPGMMGNAKQGMMAGGIDARFIEQMIPHHEDAIAMANLGLTKAEHQEIKNLSSDIIRSQSAEITQMRAWYKDWFGKEVSAQGTGMNSKGMGNAGMTGGGQNDMSTLENASNFDQEFIREMIAHHEMAIMMSNMMLSVTDRPEMKKLAKDIIAAQTKEIDDMKKWSKEWGYADKK